MWSKSFFLIFFFIYTSLVQSVPLVSEQANVTSLPPAPPGLRLVPFTGERTVVNVAQACHVLILLVIEAWKTPQLQPFQQKEWADPTYPWSFLLNVLSQAQRQYGNLHGAAWGALKIMDVNAQAMAPNQASWSFPADGYQMLNPPLEIGACGILPHPLSPSLGTSNANESSNPSHAVSRDIQSRDLTDLSADRHYQLGVAPDGPPLQRRAMIKLLFRYLQELWTRRSDGRLSSNVRAGDTYIGQPIEGMQMKVTYERLSVNGKVVTWLDVAQLMRFLLEFFAGQQTWRSFLAQGGFLEFPIALNFLSIEMFPTSGIASSQVTGNETVVTPS